MVNFGYPYNDIVICKDSTDYLVLWGQIYWVFYYHHHADNLKVSTIV